MPAENELWYQSEPSEGVACGALALGDPVRVPEIVGLPPDDRCSPLRLCMHQLRHLLGHGRPELRLRLHTLTTHYTRHKHIMVIFSPPLKGSDLARMAAALAYSSL